MKSYSYTNFLPREGRISWIWKPPNDIRLASASKKFYIFVSLRTQFENMYCFYKKTGWSKESINAMH